MYRSVVVDEIADNLQLVQDRIAGAAERSGRTADSVNLVVVTKTRPPEVIQRAVDAGITALGENRVQEARQKVDAVTGSVEWHLVGHLQRNKVRQALGMFDWIHSVDSLRLAEEIGKRAGQLQRPAKVLVQVSTSGADTQFGLNPEKVPDLVAQISEVEGLSVQGLMTIGAFMPEPEEVRPCFVRLRKLRDRIGGGGAGGNAFDFSLNAER